MTPEQAVKILRGLKLDNDTIGNVRSMVMAFQARSRSIRSRYGSF